MLGENIKILRKQKGYSQETLAQQLNVVRQTVSKWEKGISVPDAEMLNSLSELFEVPVSSLLGSTIEETKDNEKDAKMDEIAKQLAILNEQLANQSVRKKKTVKRIFIGIGIAIAAFVLFIVLWIAALILFRTNVANNKKFYETGIQCELNGETYGYEMVYDENFMIYEEGGDAYINNHIDVDQYDDANVLIAHIEDYFEEKGGTVTIVKDHVPVKR